jgi:hypothetical protein
MRLLRGDGLAVNVLASIMVLSTGEPCLDAVLATRAQCLLQHTGLMKSLIIREFIEIFQIGTFGSREGQWPIPPPRRERRDSIQALDFAAGYDLHAMAGRGGWVFVVFR